MKSANAVIFGIAIVLSSFLLGNSYVKRAQTKGNLLVTGLGKIDYTADLIVWSGSFSQSGTDMQNAYSKVEQDRQKVLEYFTQKGVSANEIVFDAVSTDYLYESKYSNDGDYIGQEQIGFKLTQSVTITSHQVDEIEKISREVTELINQGVNFYSYSPSYYFTKLSDLKLELIQKATEDARTRAEKIAQNSGSKIGKLLSANMGVFQITGQYSNEDYSWGGVYNTSSKFKTASITVRLNYEVK
ncbi:MAG: SIMPL domain-containing protein [Bacteroidales bacterium]|nr:SIMPL domain-containing protein [Bacteroidales bacterium]